MMCAYGGDKALLPLLDQGQRAVGEIDLAVLRRGLLRARVEVGNLTQYSASGTQNTLQKLLDGGHITLRQYLEQLPTGILPMRGQLIAQLEQDDVAKGGKSDD
jgi:hypothetical protein